MASQQETTQSKYQLIRKPQTDSTNIGHNEVRITTKGRVARYVNYSLGLLEGLSAYDSKNTTTQESDKESTEKKENEKTNDQEKKTDQGATETTERQARPTKKYDTIILKATGRAITKAVTTAEVVKRRVPGLHQVNDLETLEIEDQWEPLEEGLKIVTTTRRVASISITLSRDEKVVDKNVIGYQGPIPIDAVNAKPPRDNTRRGRGFGRGGFGRGGSRGFSRGRGGPRGFNRGGGRGFNRGRGGGRGFYQGGGGFSRGRGDFSRGRGDFPRGRGGFSRGGGGGFSRGGGGGFSRGGGDFPRGRGGFSRGGGGGGFYQGGGGFYQGGGGFSRGGGGFSRGGGGRSRGTGFRGRSRGPRDFGN